MEIDFLKRIVLEAEKISEKTFQVFAKGGESDVVTNLDMEIEKYLISEMNEHYPDFEIVSEEFNTNNKVSDNCFIIDPIDGTINFSNGLPLWGIQIAMRKNGETIASVINIPKLKELFYADSTGAYLNSERITVKEVPLKNTLYSIDGTNNLPSIQRMRAYSSNRRNIGTVSVAMAFLACGRLHGSVFRNESIWDYEPGLFLCKMAGAKIKSVEGFHAAAMNQEYLDILEKETAKKVTEGNIFLLHSLNGDTLRMWGPDLKDTFGQKEVNVFMPEFPIKENSSYEEFDKILSYYLGKQLNERTIVVAHSIGNAYFIRFCFEHNYQPKAYIAVAPGLIYEYPLTRTDYFADVAKRTYLKEDALNYVKNMNSIKYCLYSDESDNNKEKFTRFINDTNSIGMYLENYNHFSGSYRIYKIPELNDLIDKIL